MPDVPRLAPIRSLGPSAVGVSWDAVERLSGREVVAEIASALETQEARETFLRDARIAQRLEGEHVVRVLDVGMLRDGTPYLVREPVLTSLTTEIRTHGPLPANVAVAWTLEACEAVAEGHALGMAHGDVRTDDVFLARGDRGDLVVKVLWTGAAKAEHAVEDDQARDVSALGELLRAMLSGQIDLSEEDRARTLPTPLAEVIADTVAVAGRPRFANVAELARALAPFAPGHPGPRNVAFMLSRAGIEASPPRTTTLRPEDRWFSSHPRVTRNSIDVPVPAARGRTLTFALVVAGLVAVVALGSLTLWQTGNLPEWTGTADPAELYGTTTLTSADIRKEGTSEDLAWDGTERGIDTRAAPLASYVTKIPPPLPKRRGKPAAPRPATPPATPTKEEMPFPPVPEPAPPTIPESPDREP
jgi:serine/threonine-protein kinase